MRGSRSASEGAALFEAPVSSWHTSITDVDRACGTRCSRTHRYGTHTVDTLFTL